MNIYNVKCGHRPYRQQARAFRTNFGERRKPAGAHLHQEASSSMKTDRKIQRPLHHPSNNPWVRLIETRTQVENGSPR